jgi:hypothetical protein
MYPAMPTDQIETPEVAHSDAFRAQIAAGNTQMTSSDFDSVNCSGERDH